MKAFTAQISIALENAKLFDDVQNIKNYNESILQSMSNGVVTFDEEGKVSKCNVAASKILGLRKARFAERMSPEELFGEEQSWLTERIRSVLETGEAETLIDAAVNVRGQELSLNLGVLPLLTAQQEQLGVIVILEDISSEKRMKSTMSTSRMRIWRRRFCPRAKMFLVDAAYRQPSYSQTFEALPPSLKSWVHKEPLVFSMSISPS